MSATIKTSLGNQEVSGNIFWSQEPRNPIMKNYKIKNDQVVMGHKGKNHNRNNVRLGEVETQGETPPQRRRRNHSLELLILLKVLGKSLQQISLDPGYLCCGPPAHWEG